MIVHFVTLLDILDIALWFALFLYLFLHVLYVSFTEYKMRKTPINAAMLTFFALVLVAYSSAMSYTISDMTISYQYGDPLKSLSENSPCKYEASCSENLTCISGKCTKEKVHNESCTLHFECASTFCDPYTKKCIDKQ